MSRPVPLSTLLSWAWIAHAIEVDNAVEAAGSERVSRLFRISLAMWTNGLRFIDEGGVTVSELNIRARAACNIGGLERWGWISVGDIGRPRRDGYGTHRGVTPATVVRPTRAGTYARRLWPGALQGVEERWGARFGSDAIDDLRGALRKSALGAAAASMPWSPPEVNPSDGFRTHVIGGDVIGGDAAGGDAAGGDLPLAALLGQVLTAMTLDHEQNAEISLPLGANVLRAVGAGEVRIRDLPALTGLSKEGIAMATGYLERGGLASSAPVRVIRLTPSGLDALEGYWHHAARPEDPVLRGALEAVVAQRDSLRTGLVPPEGCWRAEKPYLAQTRRLLAEPTGALPWQPMVLHRGGWPDAS